jgi:hypothetical protein
MWADSGIVVEHGKKSNELWLWGLDEAVRKKKLSACRGEVSEAGPLLAVLRCRCAALLALVLVSALAMPNCGAQGAPTA